MNLMLDPAMVEHAEDVGRQEWGSLSATPVVPIVQYIGPRDWFVVETGIHGEDDAVAALTDRGHDCYLPRMRKEIWQPRAKKLVAREFILFNRYVFASLPATPEDWGDLTEVKEAGHVIGRMLAPDVELMEKVRSAEDDGAFDDTTEGKIRRKLIGRTKRETTMMRFPEGTSALVKGGSFGGFSGLVENVTGKSAVRVLLHILGHLVPVEFDADQLEPMGKRA